MLELTEKEKNDMKTDVEIDNLIDDEFSEDDDKSYNDNKARINAFWLEEANLDQVYHEDGDF